MQVRKTAHFALIWALGFYALAIQTAMAPMSVGLGCVVAAAFWSSLKSPNFPCFQSRIFKSYFWVTLFWSLMLVLSLVGAWLMPLKIEVWGVLKSSEISWLKDLGKILYLFWPLLLGHALLSLSKTQRSWIFSLWIFGFVGIVVLGSFQYYTGIIRPQGIPFMPGRYHVTGLFGHHLTAASVMPFAFLWLVGEFLSPQERSLSRWARAILGVFLVAACVVLFLIHSRILWLALPLGLLSFAIRIFWDSNYVRARPLRLLTLFAVSAVLIGLWYALSDPTIRGRIYKPDGLDLPMGVSERLGIWKVNWELFLERPLLGVGWHKNLELGGYLQLSRVPEGSSVFSGHAHNNIIELLASTGILGVSAFLTWQFWILRTTASLGVRGFAWLVAWGVFHLQGLTQVNLFDSKVLHTLAWVIAWTLVWKEEERA